MKSLSPNNSILASILSKGYLPKELPSTFNTHDFGQNSQQILEEWNQNSIFSIDDSVGKLPGSRRKNGSYTIKLPNTEAEILSAPKRGYERRNIHLTHIIPQSILAQEISKNWKTIAKWLCRQTYSMDQIHVSDRYDRSIKGINFELHRAKKLYIASASDWLVVTDITRFYPSIYTHSIPWAAYGKDRVKSDLTIYRGSLADRLDTLVRACNRNQTIGIPIGPETSRMLAEIISARIDSEIAIRNPNIDPANGDRLQDDWVVGADTLEDAEAILATITAAYRNYGLEINGSKTSIDHIATANQETWRSHIGSFLSHRTGNLHGARLREFLAMCLRLQSEHRSEPVVNYALSVVEGSPISPGDVQDTESFLLKAAVVAPNAMDRICRILLDLNHHTNAVSAKRVANRFIALIHKNIDKGHHYEIIWLLQTLRGLKYKFSSRRLSEYMENMPSSVIGLMILDMVRLELMCTKMPTSVWEDMLSEERILTDPSWLLAYEGFRHGWLRDKKQLMDGPFFEPIAKRNVTFYDPRRNVKLSKSVMRKNVAVRKRNHAELLRFFLQNRQIDMEAFYK